MLHSHAFGVRRREGECTPLGLVINDNIIQKQFPLQGMKAQNCIPLAVVTLIYYLCHIRGYPEQGMKVFKWVLACIVQGNNDLPPASVFRIQGGTSASPQNIRLCESCPPNFLQLNVTPCPAGDELHQACLE